MAQVIKNPDDTFVVTLTAKEHKTLDRWRLEPTIPGGPRPKARQLELAVDSDLAIKATEYRLLDGPTMRAQYEALPPAKQAEVDVILATAVVP